MHLSSRVEGDSALYYKCVRYYDHADIVIILKGSIMRSSKPREDTSMHVKMVTWVILHMTVCTMSPVIPGQQLFITGRTTDNDHC